MSFEGNGFEILLVHLEIAGTKLGGFGERCIEKYKDFLKITIVTYCIGVNEFHIHMSTIFLLDQHSFVKNVNRNVLHIIKRIKF